jgi:hypothetical protein
MIKRIWDVLSNILSEEGNLSSKRLAGFLALLNAIVLGYMSLKYNVSNTIFDGFLWFSSGCFGLSVIDKFVK